MISLGGVELSPFLQIPDWYSSVGAVGSDRKTIGGRPVATRRPSTRQITLTAKREGNKLYGHFKQSHIEAIVGFAEAGESVVLNYHGKIVMALVLLAGVLVEPVGNRTDPLPGHPYIGTVTLWVSE